jgi:hypothetical protein
VISFDPDLNVIPSRERITEPAGDDARRCEIGLLLLFTTEPTDRALAGWCARKDATTMLATCGEIGWCT